MNRVPKHIAIIPDGNRRWAKQRSTSVPEGHSEGAGNLMHIVRAAYRMGIKVITFYMFSTENWSRSQDEVSALMALLEHFLKEQKQPMIDEGVRFNTIGDLTALPSTAQNLIQEVKHATQPGKTIEVVGALNYGSRDELRRAFHRMHADIAQAKLSLEQVDEQRISHYLDTAAWPDPELMIRCSGEFRLSNFLLWQLSYAEVYIANVFWPDFTAHHLEEAVKAYQERERRLGGSASS